MRDRASAGRRDETTSLYRAGAPSLQRNSSTMMKSRLRRDLLVLLFFTALTLLMTWPLITRINTVYAGNNEDLWTFQWDNWWTRYALQHGENLLFTPVQFYPIGVSLAAHSLSFYNSLLWIPLAALFGDIAAYNARADKDSWQHMQLFLKESLAR